MFAYCGNNSVNNTDPTGHAFWGTTTIAVSDGFCGFYPGSAVYAIKEQRRQEQWKKAINAITNTDVDPVFEAEHFALYNRTLVIRHNLNDAGSFAIFGVIFLNHSHDANNFANRERILNHEYGHTLQEKEIGIAHYVIGVAIPSSTFFKLAKKYELIDNNYYNLPWEYDADMRGGVVRDHADWANIISKFYMGIWKNTP